MPEPTEFDVKNWFTESGPSAEPVIPIIVLDATQGIGDEDRYFARLVKFLDLENPIVLVANLDVIGYEQEQFELVYDEYREVLAATSLTATYFGPLPLGRPDLIPWWNDQEIPGTPWTPVQIARRPPFRMRVTSSTNEGDKWLITGTMLSGSIEPGDETLSSPSNQTGLVRAITETAGRGLQLTFDTPHFLEPGEVISHPETPPVETDVFRVKALWSAPPRNQGDCIRVATAYGTEQGRIQSVEQVLPPAGSKALTEITPTPNSFVEIIVRLDRISALDHIGSLPIASGVRLIDEQDGSSLLGLGYISMEGYADQRHLLTSKAANTTPIQFAVGESDRAERNGHEGGVLWFTGLSGAGKSTLAVALEARLFEKGYQVFVLDGDNVRQGLTSNLGFSPDDRSENIRRVGEVAALFRQAGVIVISSFISPYRSDRDRARHAAYSSFHEIYIKADIETCINRDPKGLYERAIKGEIPDFTGISAPYEAPDSPEMVVNTGASTIESCVEQLVNYVDRNFRV
ncbi:MAG: adenylyl-sulfate kinase [Rhodobiaceae bacterium]|nr:adenylyl-sulfate kinase [Rhodobiaceae bacterium]